jgi:hypothetical protein
LDISRPLLWLCQKCHVWVQRSSCQLRWTQTADHCSCTIGWSVWGLKLSAEHLSWNENGIYGDLVTEIFWVESHFYVLLNI